MYICLCVYLMYAHWTTICVQCIYSCTHILPPKDELGLQTMMQVRVTHKSMEQVCEDALCMHVYVFIRHT
jgi:hypothetical protein